MSLKVAECEVAQYRTCTAVAALTHTMVSFTAAQLLPVDLLSIWASVFSAPTHQDLPVVHWL